MAGQPGRGLDGQGKLYATDGTRNLTAAVVLHAASVERGIHTLRLDDGGGPKNNSLSLAAAGGHACASDATPSFLCASA